MARVTLYTREGCEHCDRLRARLRAAGDSIDEVNLTRTPQALNELLKLTGGRAVVPVMVRDGRIEITPDGGSSI
jgi:glutaredoxin